MSTCRWASYIGEPALCKIDEELVALPETEQVLRGQELMQMLAVAPVREEVSLAPLEGEAKFESGKAADFDWNVVVKKGFIEVVIPESQNSRKRSMSDSALPRFKSPETQWKSLMSDKIDESDASTDVSAEASDHYDASFGSLNRGDVSGSSEDGDADTEVFAQSMAPYQYIESPWHMGYDTSANFMPCTGYDQMSTGFTPACMGFEQQPMGYEMPRSSFMPATRWADHSIPAVDCFVATQDAAGPEWRTTVMIRNMPNNYTRDMLLELVNSLGFAGTYDFAYLPIDFQSQAGLGYAFINFCTVADAEQCFKVFEGFSNWKVPSEKVCTVTWSSPTQGLEQHIERYKNSPVMHHSLPDEWKPVLIQRGMRIQFPPPSKPIKTPKVRAHAARDQH